MNGLELIKHTNGGGEMTATCSTGSVELLKQGVVKYTNTEKLQIYNAFSNAFDNYLIVFGSLTSNPGGSNFMMALRNVDGSHDGSYNIQRLVADGGNPIAARFTGQTVCYGVDCGPTVPSGGHVYIYGPALRQPTAFRSVGARSAPSVQVADYASTHTSSATYNSIELGDNSSGYSQTGTLTIYGFTKQSVV
jgi:hypothetical protein